MHYYIEYRDEHGTYRITKDNPPNALHDAIDDFVIPVLLAAGYSRQAIDDYYIKNDNN